MPEPVTTITTFQTPMSIASGSGGTSTASTGVVWTGTQSNRITFGNATVTYVGAISPPVSICNDSFFRISIHFANKAAVMNMGNFYLALGNNLSNYFFAGIHWRIADSLLSPNWGNWQHYGFIKRKFLSLGSPNCATIDTVVFQADADGGTQDTLTLGAVYSYKPRINKAIAILTVDGNYLKYFQYGHPKMDSLGLRYTMFSTVDVLGQSDRVTAGQMDSIYRGGIMEVGNDGNSHDTLGYRSADSAYRNIKLGYDFIRARGWCCPTLYAMNYGSTSHVMDSMMRVSGFVDFARTTKPVDDGEVQSWGNSYGTGTQIVFGNTSTYASLKAQLDSAIASKSVSIMLAHIVEPSPAIPQSCPLSVWTEFWDYAKTKVDDGSLAVMSVGDYLEMYGGGFPPARKMGIGR